MDTGLIRKQCSFYQKFLESVTSFYFQNRTPFPNSNYTAQNANNLDEAIQLDFDLRVFTVRGSSHQLNYYCRLLGVSSNASENMLFTVSASSADELISLKVKIIEFGPKGCVAIGAAVWAIL